MPVAVAEARQMTLAQKMAIRTVALIIALVIISAAAFWGLNGLSQDLDVALDEYQKLGQAYDIGVDTATAKALLNAGVVDDATVSERLNLAINKLERLGERYPELLTQTQGASETLDDILVRVERARGDIALPEERLEIALAAGNDLNEVLGRIAKILGTVSQVIQKTQDAANAKRRTTIAVVLILGSVLIIGGVLISILQYRSVMLPLGRLRHGVHSIAEGQFANRLEKERDPEFAELASDFNQMAEQLDSLYRDLEEKVRTKSKELVRSERLASVGFLAAGVAHEINNPLGIISGYAELSLQRLEQAQNENQNHSQNNGQNQDQNQDQILANLTGDTADALRIICDEAFRCKNITEKLLTLARSGPDSRGPVALDKVAREVAEMVKGLPRYRDREVLLNVDGRGGLVVHGNETQLNQVLLNLTINGLEAVDPTEGQVTIGAIRVNQQVELTVRDNGRGMNPQTLDRIFEPFYTEKRGAGGAQGTGLGLSITHAIVEDHGGTIRAESKGLGKGSRFIVHLPTTGGAV